MKITNKKIGVFIDNGSFNSMMTSFRRRGVNIEKVEEITKLRDYSSLFIDLQYPLEMGYKLISKISADPKLSHINVFAIISKKSDLEKVTSLQNARLCDYISFRTSFEEILKKIKYFQSPSGQPMKHFPTQNLSVEINASMSHISESGCLISSKVLFNNNCDVEIYSHLINQVTGKKNNLFKISKNIPSNKGDFFTEVDFLNLSDNSRTAIRKMIVGWTLK